MKKLMTSILFLGLAYAAHAKGWYTLNTDKAKADLNSMMDFAVEKVKSFGNKSCHGKDAKETAKDTLEKSGSPE